jgi:hypothetical protein
MLQLRLSHQTSLAKTIQACLATAFESPAVRPLALAMLARFWIEQVASDQGESFYTKNECIYPDRLGTRYAYRKLTQKGLLLLSRR